MPKTGSARTLASARAYFRLAVKADMAGQHNQAAAYRFKAERLVATARNTREWARRVDAAREAARKKESPQ